MRGGNRPRKSKTVIEKFSGYFLNGEESFTYDVFSQSGDNVVEAGSGLFSVGIDVYFLLAATAFHCFVAAE